MSLIKVVSWVLFCVVSVALAVYVGVSSAFFLNPFIVLGQWLVLLIMMNVWGTIITRSIHFGTWLAVGGWVVAVIIHEIFVFHMNVQISGFGDIYTRIQRTRAVLPWIIPSIPFGYVLSWATKKALMHRNLETN